MASRKVPISEFARRLKTTEEELCAFLRAGGLTVVPEAFDGPTRSAVQQAWNRHMARHTHIEAGVAAASVGLTLDDYLDHARGSGMWWLKDSTTLMTLHSAMHLHEALLAQGFIKALPSTWPPHSSSPALASLLSTRQEQLTPESEENAATAEPDPVSPTHYPGSARAMVLAHILDEAASKSKAFRPFLFRVLERLGNDPATLAVIRADGISLSTLEELLSGRPGRAPRPSTGPTFHRDVKWAITQLRRAGLAPLWIADKGTPDARLAIRQQHRATTTRGSQSRLAADQVHVGEIRWVRLEESNRGRRSTLSHPAVIIGSSSKNKWQIVSMTTGDDGSPEQLRVPHPVEQGLAYGGFIWPALQKVYINQIGDRLGWAHPELVDLICRHVSIRQSQIEALREAAVGRHSP